jgi:DNA-directed RNA polymerase specialized sigma24 family protein
MPRNRRGREGSAPRQAQNDTMLLDLIQGLKGGSDAAWVALLEELAPMLRVIARRYGWMMGEDARQEIEGALLRVARSYQAREHRRGVELRLMGDVSNAVDTIAQRYHRRSKREVLLDDPDSIERVASEVEKQGDDLWGLVEESRGKLLDEIDYRILELRAQDVPIADVARRLGLGASQVKNRIYRARMALRARQRSAKWGRREA